MVVQAWRKSPSYATPIRCYEFTGSATGTGVKST
jgi:hypothetical protein